MASATFDKSKLDGVNWSDAKSANEIMNECSPYARISIKQTKTQTEILPRDIKSDPELSELFRNINIDHIAK